MVSCDRDAAGQVLPDLLDSRDIERDAQTALMRFLSWVFAQEMAEEATPRLSIILGQENRNSLPPFPFIVVTPLMSERLATNERRYHADGAETILQETRISFQVDFYGECALRRMTRFSTLFRDEIGCQWFVQDGCDIHPLYAENRRQLPFVSDSQQWVDRWTISASLQLDQKIKINTGSAITVGDVGIVCVDRSA
ncbi:hypothetical protein NBRC3280_2976 [Acetobacter pasteurianus NBRC 3280]|uniref:Phage neck terminator protein gp12-like domain-containing protein n=1 Tax=Acetobacter pasteurianus NBRC 3278 TaxID=1226660 RepID=A0A401X7X3_ACEPA|nr:hypothetical protein [Acetobacter pasteurianus]GCD60341.1 hypothetical protein NBRC3277_2916 [Acetobacter pasteurianus NBRC 3277]GCD63896.1 hypothetical protein NBRC3278_2989 [Acetobacter pasteurianus NBRC 3278]GCD70341.1 hypothetical protein NBRC3280_2976 [Acetobacter pasteurianus NBRC 3280]